MQSEGRLVQVRLKAFNKVTVVPGAPELGEKTTEESCGVGVTGGSIGFTASGAVVTEGFGVDGFAGTGTAGNDAGTVLT